MYIKVDIRNECCHLVYHSNVTGWSISPIKLLLAAYSHYRPGV